MRCPTSQLSLLHVHRNTKKCKKKEISVKTKSSKQVFFNSHLDNLASQLYAKVCRDAIAGANFRNGATYKQARWEQACSWLKDSFLLLHITRLSCQEFHFSTRDRWVSSDYISKPIPISHMVVSLLLLWWKLLWIACTQNLKKKQTWFLLKVTSRARGLAGWLWGVRTHLWAI